MPDLIIEPEIGDSIYECFEAAYQAMCADKTLRSASFTVNGLTTTITKRTKR